MTAAEWESVVDGHKATLAAIHPDVLSATDDELIAAGWSDIDRVEIPPNWRNIDFAGWWRERCRLRGRVGKLDDKPIILLPPKPRAPLPPRPGRYKPNPKQALMAKVRERLNCNVKRDK